MTILVAIDEDNRSQEIISISYDLAEKYNETLIGIHVIPEENYSAYKQSVEEVSYINNASITQEEDSAKRIAQKVISNTIDEFDKTQVETRGRVGDVASEVLSEAKSIEPRFLVISGRRRSPTGKAIFGNTAQRILLNADCPVISNLVDIE